MGLYDRDYMRDPPDADSQEPVGEDRLQTRRRWLIGVGLLLLVGGMLAMFVMR